MSKTYTKDEVLENGRHYVSVYDADKHYLISTYSTLSDGTKDGDETIYFENSKAVLRKIPWKNGVKDGWEKEYYKDGYFFSQKKYEKGKCVKKREYLYGLKGKSLEAVMNFLKKNDSVLGKLESTGYDKYYCGKTGRYLKAHVVKENGEFKHITLKEGDDVLYDMEIRDSKEYEGTYNFPEWKNFTPYKGEFHDGKLTGFKEISQKDSLCDEFIPSGLGYSDKFCWEIFEDGNLVSHDASYYWTDGFNGWNYSIRIPMNGMAYEKEMQDGLTWHFYMKDGKRDGEYRVGGIHAFYKDGVLDGNYVKRQHRRDKKTKEIHYEQYKTSFKNGVESKEYLYTEFFDNFDGNKKVEGSYKNGKKSGLWKYYDKEGNIINQEFYQNGRNMTDKYDKIKAIAAQRIEKEKQIEVETGVKTRLPKMTKSEKRVAMIKQYMGLKDR